MSSADTRRSWGASLLLHGALFLLLVFRPDFFSHRPRVIEQGNDATQQVIQATVVQETVPVKRAVVASAPVPPRPVPVPTPTPSQRPLVRPEQLLADLKKDIAKQKSLQQAALQKQKILNAKALQKQLLAEKIRVDGERSSRMRGVVDRYRALIIQVISQNWRVPGVPDKRLSADLMIHLAPGGTVLDVQVTRSSGNPALDNSARAAVFRSSPLPVPEKPIEFEPFRSFVLKVVPEDILAAQ